MAEGAHSYVYVEGYTVSPANWSLPGAPDGEQFGGVGMKSKDDKMDARDRDIDTFSV
jgi:hypothetical protein